MNILAISLLLFQFSYAVDAIQKKIEALEEQKAQLIQAQKEFKAEVADTRRYLNEALDELQAARAELNASDQEAIAALLEKRDELLAAKAALEERIENANERDLLAEVAALNTRITELRASLQKLRR